MRSVIWLSLPASQGGPRSPERGSRQMTREDDARRRGVIPAPKPNPTLPVELMQNHRQMQLSLRIPYTVEFLLSPSSAIAHW
jgi:hypothetical protein